MGGLRQSDGVGWHSMSEQTPWWLDPGFLAFDTETTGTDPATDRIVTAALVHFSKGEPVTEREWLLKLDIPIPQASTDVHGITDEHSRANGQDEGEALTEIHQHITASGLPIVAFNATFDLDMLNANLARHQLDPITSTPVICPYILDKQFDKYVKGRNQRRLMPTVQRYGLDLDEDSWHGTTADATIQDTITIAPETTIVIDSADRLRMIGTVITRERLSRCDAELPIRHQQGPV